jgi:hypothetical protein
VVVFPVNQRDLDRNVAQLPGSPQTAKPTADDYYARFASIRLGRHVVMIPLQPSTVQKLSCAIALIK